MSDIKNFDIRTHITHSIVDVFDTMVSMQVELFDSEPPDTTGTGRMVVATVNLAGNVAGILNIQVASEMSRLMTAGRLGIETGEVEDDGQIKKLLTEISNIVGGNLKSALNDAGLNCLISTPSITCGTDFTIKSLKMERFERFIFIHQENFIWVEVGLKTQPASADEDESEAADALAQHSKADIEKIAAPNLNSRVSGAVIDVFDTKLALKLEPADAATAETPQGIRNAGSVSFAGDVTGRVSIHTGDSFSRKMAAAMLGRGAEEIEGDEEIRDMLGEIDNSVAENLKSAFTDAGLMCALCTPSFTSGTDFEIEALNMENYERFAFRCGENIIFVEMEVNVAGRERAQISVDPHETRTAEPEQPPVQAEENVHAKTRDSKTPEDVDLDLLLDIPLEIKVELGRSRIKIRKLLNLTPGSAIKLIKLEGEPVDILVNETLIARGEVIVQNAKYGIRVTEITSRVDRLRSFSL